MWMNSSMGAADCIWGGIRRLILKRAEPNSCRSKAPEEPALRRAGGRVREGERERKNERKRDRDRERERERERESGREAIVKAVLDN